MLFVFVVVLDEFDAEKTPPSTIVARAIRTMASRAAAQLRRMHGQRHRQAAAEQHRRVDRAEPHIEMTAGGAKRSGYALR